MLLREKLSMNKILLASLVVGLLLLIEPSRAAFTNQPAADLIQSIERVKLHDGRTGSPTWFLPRVCVVPQQRGALAPLALMTLQTIAGSDYYGLVHWRESRDNGQTWSAPQPVPNLGRRPYQGDIEEA